ncbi:hypothetical protein F5Y03DRAFT_389602 [Xylaria venustula]|nr:hypothetical protein F5Y03DRAFT_389602 [Xylaria venustula]
MAAPRKWRPLSLSRAMEGHPISSAASPLFSIPTEILEMIATYVARDKSHLASLALVNSGCRQLARTFQFKTVVLNYDSTALSILGLLQKEARHWYLSSNRITAPSMGTCIRELCVNTSNYWLYRNGIAPKPLSTTGMTQKQIETERADHLVTLLVDNIEYLYWPAVYLVIPRLSNLRYLAIEADDVPVALNDELLDCLVGLPIEELRLEGKCIHPLTISPVVRDICPRLKVIDVLVWQWVTMEKDPGPFDSSPFFQALFRSCAATLESVCIGQRVTRKKRYKFEPIHFNSLEFPKLKFLHISYPGTILTSSALSSLTPQGLRFLCVRYGEPSLVHFLSERGRINTLETLILDADSQPAPEEMASLRFIKSNDQIKTLLMMSPCRDCFIVSALLSIRHHETLKKLYVHWFERSISDDSLNALSRLCQVEVLCIGAGAFLGHSHDWFVDHKNIKAHLGHLTTLRRLMFRRDTYQLPPDESEHEARMLEIATEYVKALPNLEFLVVGKVLFTVYEEQGTRKPVVSGSDWPDDDSVYHKEFGLPGSYY